MSDASSFEGFSDFFDALWGFPPFDWQRRLSERALKDMNAPWPRAIALGTASGKTACIDIAIYALAANASESDGMWTSTSPRRIFFVVDRRIIVDEAFERARRIAQRLREANGGILRLLADRLRRLAGGDIPLMCFQLRGGMYRSDAWARSPLQPAVIASTVDQIGSRLLFRAYGRSNRAWPIQAGLAANDSLLLLDEAHCSKPFMETLHAIEKYRKWSKAEQIPPFHASILSATPPETDDIFRDASEEGETPTHPLGARRLASKRATLISVDRDGASGWESMARALARSAEDLAEGQSIAVVVFANYVALAREVHRILATRHGENAILLTGRMRSIDKEDTVTERLHAFSLSSGLSTRRQLDAPVFVVATQTLEVGADLDFDALVTQCASLDALLQRFGRLNRMGRPIDAQAAILIQNHLIDASDDDPVYGSAISFTWQWLNDQADEQGRIDMGIAAITGRLPARGSLAALNAPSGSAPVMLPAHLDCWVQTAPEPVPTPAVSIFLHGPENASADVQALWRADIDLSAKEKEEASLDVLALCPPSATESLAVPIWAFQRWMKGHDAAAESVSDVEGATDAATARTPILDSARLQHRVIRWRGRAEAEIIDDADNIRPGDVIVIPAAEKGWDVLGDLPRRGTKPPILDLGDRAYLQSRARALLRIHPSVIDCWPAGAYKAAWLELARSAPTALDEDPEGFIEQIQAALEHLASDGAAPDWLRVAAERLFSDPRLKRSITPHPMGEGMIIRGSLQIDPQALQAMDSEVDWFTDEDDAGASGTSHVSLPAHLDGVAALARRFSKGCGLPDSIASCIETAGKLHDLGKADRRFQALLRGGNPLAWGELLAKSEEMPQGRSAQNRARRAAGYPDGFRHELLSVIMAGHSPYLQGKDDACRDLTLHLIGSHHGHCRPLAPVVDDPAPVDVSMELDGHCLKTSSDTGLQRLDSGVSDRFWRLTRHYGWWGLAWLEAIFRLSDHRQSEREEMLGRGKR